MFTSIAVSWTPFDLVITISMINVFLIAQVYLYVTFCFFYATEITNLLLSLCTRFKKSYVLRYSHRFGRNKDDTFIFIDIFARVSQNEFNDALCNNVQSHTISETNHITATSNVKKEWLLLILFVTLYDIHHYCLIRRWIVLSLM